MQEVVAMPAVHALAPSDLLILLGEQSFASIDTVDAEPVCRDLGLFGFVARENGRWAGHAIARSRPDAVIVAQMKGSTRVCLLLLKQLVRRAGERELAVWCSAKRSKLCQVLARMGFHRMYATRFEKTPTYLYRLGC
jgi:hypothetical protein